MIFSAKKMARKKSYTDEQLQDIMNNPGLSDVLMMSHPLLPLVPLLVLLCLLLLGDEKGSVDLFGVLQNL